MSKLSGVTDIGDGMGCRLPDSTPCACLECEWIGTLGDCETEKTSEGGLSNEYEIAGCPKCESCCEI